MTVLSPDRTNSGHRPDSPTWFFTIEASPRSPLPDLEHGSFSSSTSSPRRRCHRVRLPAAEQSGTVLTLLTDRPGHKFLPVVGSHPGPRWRTSREERWSWPNGPDCSVGCPGTGSHTTATRRCQSARPTKGSPASMLPKRYRLLRRAGLLTGPLAVRRTAETTDLVGW